MRTPERRKDSWRQDFLLKKKVEGDKENAVDGWHCGCQADNWAAIGSTVHKSWTQYRAGHLMCGQVKGGDLREEKWLKWWSTQNFDVIFYFSFQLDITVCIIVCLAALTAGRPSQHQETFYLAEAVPAPLCDPFLQPDKQRATFVDAHLTPLVSKTQLKGVLRSFRPATWCFAQVWQRRAVLKPRTEAPSPKSQPGTLTESFWFCCLQELPGQKAHKFFGILHSWRDKWPDTITGDTCFWCQIHDT